MVTASICEANCSGAGLLRIIMRQGPFMAIPMRIHGSSCSSMHLLTAYPMIHNQPSCQRSLRRRCHMLLAHEVHSAAAKACISLIAYLPPSRQRLLKEWGFEEGAHLPHTNLRRSRGRDIALSAILSLSLSLSLPYPDSGDQPVRSGLRKMGAYSHAPISAARRLAWRIGEVSRLLTVSSRLCHWAKRHLAHFQHDSCFSILAHCGKNDISMRVVAIPMMETRVLPAGAFDALPHTVCSSLSA